MKSAIRLLSRLAGVGTVSLMFSFSSPSWANRLDLVVNGKSYHLNTDAPLNERNLGLGMEYEFDAKDRWMKFLVANGFRDSMDNMSYMMGVGLKRRGRMPGRLNLLSIDIGLTGFLMAREDVNDGKPFPGVLPSVSVGTRAWAVNLSFFPTKLAQRFSNARRYENSSDGVLFLQVKINAKNFLPVVVSDR